jgi:hypothetical protein
VLVKKNKDLKLMTMNSLQKRKLVKGMKVNVMFMLQVFPNAPLKIHSEKCLVSLDRLKK